MYRDVSTPCEVPWVHLIAAACAPRDYRTIRRFLCMISYPCTGRSVISWWLLVGDRLHTESTGTRLDTQVGPRYTRYLDITTQVEH